MSTDNMRELSNTLISVDKDQTYEDFCIQLQTLNDHLTKLKSIQNSDRRCYTSVTYTLILKNDNADVMN
ncbi:hypothetical protein BDBG_17200 [Blastomyces gilchristii SLH14081]|uniref:Uncharacterized protein n=1 Tax=Blastomyces gilchristii (strain SLH14081) TaxID=559298 RepID=A0A179UNC3_BLAGS|nr:uncharacterized protein BDBG_17200 [Blastomyces gilchristii SLH14081]OAT09350.1 hypothetical protein BDBG_17200 [Blastomyces gilchristii SLH14081]